MSSNLIGQVIANQFRVDSFISAGGMGAVFRVWDLKRNVPLAMKVLHSDLAEDQVMFERFKREARALRKLEHPNIIPFYGLYETPQLIFLLERYIDGPTLKEVLKQEKSGNGLTMAQVMSIMKAICSAVGYAHNNNVIHCDIKTANVMVDRGGQIYLGDFGIARHAESDVTAMPGAGTPAYMAPEQILGKAVTRETDVYALGILLFELLTGKRPFRGNELSSEKSGQTVNERIRYAQLNLPAPDPRMLNPSISPAIAGIVMRSLEKDPGMRYASCQELMMALCHANGMNPEQIPDRLEGAKIKTGMSKAENNAQGSALKKPDTPKKSLMIVGSGVILALLLGLLLMMGRNDKPGPNPVIFTMMTLKDATTTPKPVDQKSKYTVPSYPPTAISSPLPPTKTSPPLATPTKDGSCGVGFSPRFKIGDTATVCTYPDRLKLRPEHEFTEDEIIRIYPSARIKIIGGPWCDPETVWWQVSVPKGSQVWNNYQFTSKVEYTGWVREGGIDGNHYDYYICPVN